MKNLLQLMNRAAIGSLTLVVGLFAVNCAVALASNETVATELELTVSGMTCQSCSNAIQGTVGKLEHVTSVTADHVSGKVTVSCDGQCPDKAEIAATIEKLGYQVKND